ncbi:MAG: choice-of-anchor D domain-containing protein [Planctomycetes bacterium]|nr:choice-of-anchor D domain-containing protein [Planctomycetota bacterium]
MNPRRILLVLTLFSFIPMLLSCDIIINPSLRKIGFDKNTIDFHGVKLGEERIATFEIMNIGARDIIVNKISFTSFGGETTADEFSIVEGYTDGENTIIPGEESVTIKVMIKCKTSGAKSTLIKVHHDANNLYSPYIINVSAICTEAEIEILPTSCDFGSLLIYNRKMKYFSIKNTGQSGLVVLGLNITGNTSNFKILTFISLPVQIVFNETIMIAIEFYSMGTEGFKEAFFEVSHNASNKPTPCKIRLTGETVLEQPLIEISPTLHDFGFVSIDSGGAIDQEQVNSSAEVWSWWSVWQSFKAGKSGELRKVEVYLANPFNQLRTFELRVGIGSSGQLLVQKTVTVPTNYAWLSISIPQQIFLTVGLSYTWVIYGPGLTNVRTHLVNPYTLGRSYHDTNADLMFKTYMLENSTKNFLIRNIGNKDLIVSKIELSGTDRKSFIFVSGHNAPYTIKPGLMHLIKVRFLPSAPVGGKSGSLKLEHNATSSPTFIYISGNAY